MQGNYQVYEYAMTLWAWGINLADDGTIGTDVYTFVIDNILPSS